jgi:ssDNA-binding Zn-finger/Zn-ribbon topoisomerase 1
MPVKVRCQSCEKVFAAPDAARGKLVKCPGCEEKVKVPAGDGAKSSAGAKAPAKKPTKKKDDHDDHEHALKSLDLDKVEDENARICPKCGQEIYEEETYECPACGLNFETGMTKEKQRGVDPKIFYKVVLKDSKQFLLDNKRLAIRTGIYTLVFTLVNFACGFMVTWCVSPPPRMFWLGLFVITGMVPNGWLWFLNSEIIKATMDKREKMPRINFDMFTCVALGIKLLVWAIVMGSQLVLPLVAGFLFRQGMTIPGAVLLGVSGLILFPMIPQVMIHMTMPVTTRGWLLHYQFKGWAKSIGACAYWCAITFVLILPALVPAGIACAIGYRGLIQFTADMTHNYRANATYGADMEVFYAARNNPKKGEAAPIEPDREKDAKYQTRPIAWTGFIAPAVGMTISQFLFGFSAVFAMRANGLFGLYFKKHLKLETMAKEVKWVAKGVQADDDPATKKAKQKQQLIQNIVAIVAFLAVIGGVAWWMMRKPAGDAVNAPAGQPGDPAGQPAGQPVPPAGMMPAGMPPGGAAPATPAGAAGLAPPM